MEEAGEGLRVEPVSVPVDKPVQIVKICDESEEHAFVLQEEALNQLLNQDGIRDLPICIISVAG